MIEGFKRTIIRVFQSIISPINIGMFILFICLTISVGMNDSSIFPRGGALLIVLATVVWAQEKLFFKILYSDFNKAKENNSGSLDEFLDKNSIINKSFDTFEKIDIKDEYKDSDVINALKESILLQRMEVEILVTYCKNKELIETIQKRTDTQAKTSEIFLIILGTLVWGFGDLLINYLLLD